MHTYSAYLKLNFTSKIEQGIKPQSEVQAVTVSQKRCLSAPHLRKYFLLNNDRCVLDLASSLRNSYAIIQI